MGMWVYWEFCSDAIHQVFSSIPGMWRCLYRFFCSALQQWKAHLSSEVERVIMQGVGLEHLPQEKVMIAIALTLVKRVCIQAPVLLRYLFQTAAQYINPERALWRSRSTLGGNDSWIWNWHLLLVISWLWKERCWLASSSTFFKNNTKASTLKLLCYSITCLVA